MKCNSMTYREIADIFKEMGIADLSDDEVKKIKAMSEWPGREEDAFFNKVGSVLSAIGQGDYNADTNKWVLTSKTVYSFDVEVADVDNMYSIFLNGISFINNNEFKISQIKEDISKVNYEEGTGIQTISFCYNDKPYSYDAKVNYDWFDINIITFMNDILEKEGNKKRLYCMAGDGQDCIVLYCSDEWAQTFYEKTGCRLEK